MFWVSLVFIAGFCCGYWCSYSIFYRNPN